MNLAAVEIKAFVPATDFVVSMRFYGDFTRFDPSGVVWRIAHNLPRT